MSVRSPQVRTTTFPSYICRIYNAKLRAVLDFVLLSNRVRFALPFIRFLFVRPRVCSCRYFLTFTSGFLQIPPHGGHPCLRLTVPTAKSVADFHRQVVAHAGRTQKTASRFFMIRKLFLVRRKEGIYINVLFASSAFPECCEKFTC